MAYQEPGPRFDKKRFRRVLEDVYNPIKGVNPNLGTFAEKGSRMKPKMFIPASSYLSDKSLTGIKKQVDSVSKAGVYTTPTDSTPETTRVGVPSKTNSGIKIDWKNVGKSLENIVPFASNIANAFRRPPKPIAPNLISPVSLRKPTNGVELREIDRSVNSLNTNADQSLDQNTAAAVKSANLIQGLRAKGASNERTANQGIQVDNQAATINSQINMANMHKLDQYNDDKVNMQIAKTREASENVSNASDKFVQIGARKDAMALDRQRFDILSKVYANSGVTDRLVRQILNKKPEDTITPEEYDEVLGTQFKRFGGLIRIKKLKKHEGSTPPEMASQYMANGGRIGGSIMHTPKRTRTRQLKKLY